MCSVLYIFSALCELFWKRNIALKVLMHDLICVQLMWVRCCPFPFPLLPSRWICVWISSTCPCLGSSSCSRSSWHSNRSSRSRGSCSSPSSSGNTSSSLASTKPSCRSTLRWDPLALVLFLSIDAYHRTASVCSWIVCSSERNLQAPHDFITVLLRMPQWDYKMFFYRSCCRAIINLYTCCSSLGIFFSSLFFNKLLKTERLT